MIPQGKTVEQTTQKEATVTVGLLESGEIENATIVAHHIILNGIVRS